MYTEQAMSASSFCNFRSSGLLSRTGFVCLTVFTATCFNLPLPATTIFEALKPLSSANAAEESVPSELQAMAAPLEEVEEMLADGTFINNEFSISVSSSQAATFAKTIQHKLRTAKAEYTRLPRAIRTSAEADRQWYRMDALIDLSETFAAARQRHAQALANQTAAAPPAASEPETLTTELSQQQATAVDPQAAARKQAAETRAAAVRAQQEAVKQRAAEVAAQKKAKALARAAGVEPTGPDWQNSYIPNIEELERQDGFFQWPWSQPSWQAVRAKAAEEQRKGALGTLQVELFEQTLLEQANQWPAVARIQDAGDAAYALEMIRKRESSDGLEIVDLWISRPDWKIQKNALGAIESRTKPGYLLYTDPSGQGCILKQFWIEEPYAGGGNYERTTRWRYADIRFQGCD